MGQVLSAAAGCRHCDPAGRLVLGKMDLPFREESHVPWENRRGRDVLCKFRSKNLPVDRPASGSGRSARPADQFHHCRVRRRRGGHRPGGEGQPLQCGQRHSDYHH